MDFLLCSNVLTRAIVGRANRCYFALTGLTILAVKATMMLSLLITMNFLVVCSTNLNQKKNDAAKRLEGFLSAAPAKKMMIISLLMQR